MGSQSKKHNLLLEIFFCVDWHDSTFLIDSANQSMPLRVKNLRASMLSLACKASLISHKKFVAIGSLLALHATCRGDNKVCFTLYLSSGFPT